MTNESEPRTRGRNHNIIKGGDGKVLYDSDKDKDKQSGKSSNTIYSGDGKRILYEDKE